MRRLHLNGRIGVIRSDSQNQSLRTTLEIEAKTFEAGRREPLLRSALVRPRFCVGARLDHFLGVQVGKGELPMIANDSYASSSLILRMNGCGPSRYERLKSGFALPHSVKKRTVRRLAKIFATLAKIVSALSWVLIIAALPFIIVKLLAIGLNALAEALWCRSQ